MRGVGTSFALATSLLSGDVRNLHRCAQTFAEDGVERDGEGAPTAFRIWAAGKVVTDHGDHLFTQESASKLLADQATRGNRFSIDVDHMSLNDQAPPENHKAVGWFSVEVRDGDLWAVSVEWTKEIAAGLTAKPPEWKYFSPAYETKKKSGEIVRLLNLALTNNPATHEVTALATTATSKEKAAMADEKDEKKEQSLGEMLAAYEAEKDEEKRSKMKEAVRAKFKAAFGEEPDGDEKKEPAKKEEKKASEDGGEKKEEKKASADDADGDEKKAASMAQKIADQAVERFEASRKAKEETAAKDRILSSLSAGDRETYKDLNLVQLERVVKRHHAEVLTNFASAGNVQPTRGKSTTTTASMLPVDESRKLDIAMGIFEEAPFVEEKGTKLVFNPMSTAKDAEAMLASIQATKKSAGVNDREALATILANQKGG